MRRPAPCRERARRSRTRRFRHSARVRSTLSWPAASAVSRSPAYSAANARWKRAQASAWPLPASRAASIAPSCVLGCLSQPALHHEQRSEHRDEGREQLRLTGGARHRDASLGVHRAVPEAIEVELDGEEVGDRVDVLGQLVIGHRVDDACRLRAVPLRRFHVSRERAGERDRGSRVRDQSRRAQRLRVLPRIRRPDAGVRRTVAGRPRCRPGAIFSVTRCRRGRIRPAPRGRARAGRARPRGGRAAGRRRRTTRSAAPAAHRESPGATRMLSSSAACASANWPATSW